MLLRAKRDHADKQITLQRFSRSLMHGLVQSICRSVAANDLKIYGSISLLAQKLAFKALVNVGPQPIGKQTSHIVCCKWVLQRS